MPIVTHFVQELASKANVVRPSADEQATVVVEHRSGDMAPPMGEKRGPPDKALPDLIRFLDAHPELKTDAEAGKVSSCRSIKIMYLYCAV
jgi:hypothetical protein